jgi:hypothetical protein
MEQNTFRKINESTIVLDGLIWGTNTDKIIHIRNTDSGFKVHSIEVDGTYYYPIGIDRNNKNKSYVQIIIKEK